MQITQDFIPVGCNNRKGVKLSGIKGLVIHWIGVAQPNAKVIRNNFASVNGRVGATQYIIDYNTGEIIQTMPENEMTYHVGNETYTRLKQIRLGSGNPNFKLVGIECCINKNDVITNDYANKKTNKELGKPSDIQYEKLVEFSADFLLRYKLTTDNLYRHYDITGKACHVYFYKNEDEWEKFKKDVQEKMEDLQMVRYQALEEIPEWYKPTIEKLVNAKILSGNGKGLDLSEDNARQWTMMDRLGVLDFFVERRNNNAE